MSNVQTMRTWVELNFLLVMAMMVLIVYSFFPEKRSRDYYHVHNALFVCSVIIVLLLVLRRFDVKRMFRNLFRFQSERTVLLIDWLTLISYMQAIFALVIVDTSFMSDFGLRISAVVSVNVVIIVKSIWQSRHSRWTLE